MRVPKASVRLAIVTLLMCVAGTAALGVPRQNAEPQNSPSAKSGSIAPEKSSDATETATERLPVRRVILYKSGVGYFEHVGEIHGNETVRVDFTSKQLNDVLQS